MKKATAALAVVAALVLAAVAYATTNEASGPTHATAVAANAASTISCSKAKIGVLAPLTGGAASIGQEQKNWVKFMVARANKANHTKFGVVEGDTQLNAAQALIVGKQFVSNKNILATVGPAGSQEVLSAGPALKGKLPFISGSATNVTLTDGRFKGWFFRTVGSDKAQGRSDATFVAKVLKAKDVEIIDDQTSYATGLASFASSTFKALKVKVRRASVSQSESDFSSVISSIPSSVKVTMLFWQLAAKGQVFYQQSRQQGKRYTVFGSDGLFDPSSFTADGSYVSSFAFDIHRLAADRSLVRAYQRKYGKFGTFGPPSGLAGQVIANAMKKACKDGKASRAEVRKFIARTNMPKTILGLPLTFNAVGDNTHARFYIFKIQNGQYVFVQ
jgi:branched-chain amino acid transport system substrate-binding protein